jgi:hypothetical protein
MQPVCSTGCAHRWSLGASMNSLPVPAPAVIPRGLREARTSRVEGDRHGIPGLELRAPVAPLELPKCEVLDIENLRLHSTRRTMITWARRGGTRPDRPPRLRNTAAQHHATRMRKSHELASRRGRSCEMWSNQLRPSRDAGRSTPAANRRAPVIAEDAAGQDARERVARSVRLRHDGSRRVQRTG